MRRPIRARRLLFWSMSLALAAIVVFLLYIGASVTIFVQRVQAPSAAALPAPAIPHGERVNILLLGVDGEKDRTDTMVLASIDPDDRKVGVLQIPRDTRATLAGKGAVEKINHAYAYGVGDKAFPGPQRAMKTVENLLSVPVHYYVLLDFEGFRAIVDLLGGVELDIKERMYYEDPYQGLVIDLKPGRQVLDGAKAMQFVRYREYPNGDLGRVEAQQQFVRALLDKMFSVGAVVKLPSLSARAAAYVETNLERGRILSLARALAGVSRSDIQIDVLPGVDAYIGGVSYYLVDPIQSEPVLDRLLRGSDRQPKAGGSDARAVSAP